MQSGMNMSLLGFVVLVEIGAAVALWLLDWIPKIIKWYQHSRQLEVARYIGNTRA